ncbi:MAG: hypothetical protein O7J95_18150, partial [Planctomycetota bacterium]|nr:hypothetical protein [Planctomycetota bacterium]
MAFDSRRSYTDGNLAPAGTFDVTAGSGSDFDGVSYVAIGLGATPLSGALDVDYIRVKAGVHAPVKSSQIPALSPWGLSLAAL